MRLIEKYQTVLNALTLVHNSGPLNAGLSDENTMKIVDEAIKKVS